MSLPAPPSPPATSSGFDVTSRQTRDGTETLIIVNGAFDAVIAPTLQRTVDRMRLTPQDRVVVDLGNVRSADAAGLRLVLHVHARCLRARCELIVHPAPPAVHEFFTDTHAADVLPFAAAPEHRRR